MALALILALVAMFLYGTSTVMEAIGARRTDTAEGVDVTLFARLARQPLYIGGLVVDAVGFACHLFALRTRRCSLCRRSSPGALPSPR